MESPQRQDWGDGEGEKEEKEAYKLQYLDPSQDYLFSVLLYRNKEEELEGEKEQGRGNKTPIDPLSCFQRCEQSSGTSSKQAQRGSPKRQIEKNMLAFSKNIFY